MCNSVSQLLPLFTKHISLSLTLALLSARASACAMPDNPDQLSGQPAQSSAATSSILRGIDLIGQTQQPGNSRGHVPSRANSNSLLSMSSTLLSSRNDGGSNQPSSSHNEDPAKRNKKHKHHSKERSSKHKKHRRDTTIADSSAITLSSAENIIRYNSKDHHIHRHRSSSYRPYSSSSSSYPADTSASRNAPSGYNNSQPFVIPSQFLNQQFGTSQSSLNGDIPAPMSYLNGLPVSTFSGFQNPTNPTVNPSAEAAVPSANAGTSLLSSARDAVPSGAPPVIISGFGGGMGVQAPLTSTRNGNHPPVLLCQSQQSLQVPKAAEPKLQPQSQQQVQLSHTQHNLASRGDMSQTQTVQCPVPPKTLSSSTTSSLSTAANSITNSTSSVVASRICAQNTVTNVSIEDLRALFHLTLVDASKQLGMCTTLFKKICRQKNIEKWPYRKIHSLMNRVESLKQYLADGEATIPERVKKSYTDQIVLIMEKVNNIREGFGGQKGSAESSSDTISNVTLSCDDDSGTHLSALGLEQREKDKQPPPLPQTETQALTERMQNEAATKASTSFSTSPRSASPRSDTASGSDGSSVSANGEPSHKRARYKTSYDLKTGWVANCSTCGKLGKYRHPSQGRVFQHSSGTGKYCGYFRDNPRNEQATSSDASNNSASANTSSANGAGKQHQSDRLEEPVSTVATVTVVEVQSKSPESDPSNRECVGVQV